MRPEREMMSVKGVLTCISFTDLKLYKINIYELPMVRNVFFKTFLPFVDVYYNMKENKG